MEIVNQRLNIHPFYLYNMPTQDPRPTATTASDAQRINQFIQNLHGDDAQQRSRRFIQDLEAAVTQTPLLDQALRDIETAEARAALQQAQAAIPNPPPPQPAMVSSLTNSTPLTIALAKVLPCGYPMTLINHVSSRYIIGTIVAFHRPHASPNYSEVTDVNTLRQAPFPVLNSSLAAMVVMDRSIIFAHKRKKDIEAILEVAQSRGWKMDGEARAIGSVMLGRDKKISWPDSVASSSTVNIVLSEETTKTILFMITLGSKPPIDALVPQSILDIIRNAPGMSRLRGMVLAATKLRLPPDVIAAGSDAMVKWLEDNIKFQPLVAAPVPTVVDPAMVEVKYRLVRRYDGRHWYSRDAICEGSINLPTSVVAAGGRSMEDILWDHANEAGDWKDGDPRYGDMEDEDSNRHETVIL